VNRYLYHNVFYVTADKSKWENFCRASQKPPSKVAMCNSLHQILGNPRPTTVVVLAADWSETGITREEVIGQLKPWYPVHLERDLTPLAITDVRGQLMVPAISLKPRAKA
jgi:hypothetical protein